MESTRIELSDRVEYRNEQGDLHREDGPALEYSNGSKYWYLNGKYHREDGPAREWSSGIKYWYLNSKRYSEQEYNEELLKIRLQRLIEL